MTKDDIIRMAREAGVLSGYESELFQRFAHIVAAAEREACAKVCLEEDPSLDGQICATAIRARVDK
jgi:hypothetical protein